MSKSNTPPKLLLQFFRWYCHQDFAEDIEGDLLERFDRITEEKGIRLAKWRFTKDVIKLFRPGIIKQFNGGYKLSNYDMFRNNFKIMLRNLIKRKSYATINVLGPSAGYDFSVKHQLPVFMLLREADGFVEKISPAFIDYISKQNQP